MEGSRSLGGSVVQKQTSESESLVNGRNPVEVEPHEALFLALAYLRFMDLFRIRTVCKSLRDAVDGDALLWEKVVLEPPMSWKVNDLILLNLVSKSKGKLSSLALIDCWFFTDSALHNVAKTNPNITQLHVPGCTALTPGGVARAVEKLNKLKHLRVYGIPNMEKEHLDTLNSLLRVDPKRNCHPYSSSMRGDPSIDVEICMKCDEVRLVFDCPREECREKQWQCRGCLFCIARCKECGRCLSLEDEVGGETICSDSLCSTCWLRLPKCMLCNKPSCSQHLYLRSGSSPGSTDFTCELCASQPVGSAISMM